MLRRSNPRRLRRSDFSGMSMAKGEGSGLAAGADSCGVLSTPDLIRSRAAHRDTKS
jgi:hypothetical protein